MLKGHCPPVPLERVLAAELLEIQQVRNRRGTIGKTGEPREPALPPNAPIAGKADPDEPAWQKDDVNWVDAVSKAHVANLVGLAFSGGGIRSATFNLGVLQALAELKLLHRIDYLSTVSGGGYIGGWLAAWTKRLKSFGEVQKRLATNRVHQIDDKEPTPIRFLRVFSNYLTPKLGIFSGDTLAMVAIYLRNLLLNQTIVLAVLTALLLVPRLVEKWSLATEGIQGMERYWISAGIVLLVVAFLVILNNMAYLDCRDDGGARQFMSLNLVKGKDLAWQERMAESFVMTPRYCGFDVWLEEQDSPMMRQQRPITKDEVKKREAEEARSVLRRWLGRLERYGYRPTNTLFLRHSMGRTWAWR